MIVSGHQVPALTVASFATTTTSRPSTTPTPVITPAPGAWPSYWSYATSSPISSQGVPGSSSRSTRSRGASLPCSCILATARRRRPAAGLAASCGYSSVSARSRGVRGRTGALTVSPRWVAAQDSMYSMRSEVGVPGPNSRPIPRFSSASMSSCGMIPPPVTRMSARPWSQQLPHPGKERHVRPRKNRESHHVHVLLHRRARDHLRRLVQPGVDHLHAGVASAAATTLAPRSWPSSPGLATSTRIGRAGTSCSDGEHCARG